MAKVTITITDNPDGEAATVKIGFSPPPKTVDELTAAQYLAMIAHDAMKNSENEDGEEG